MRNRITYVVSLWREALGRSYERISPVYVVGASLDHARSRARELVEARLLADTGSRQVIGTEWTLDREMRRAPYAVIEASHAVWYPSRVRRGMRHVDTIKGHPGGRYEIVQGEGRIVPSVGQLGWTP